MTGRPLTPLVYMAASQLALAALLGPRPWTAVGLVALPLATRGRAS